MLTNITIGKYINKNSIIHKIHPLFKIISLLLIIIISLLSNTLENFLILLFILFISILTNIDFKMYLKNIYGLRFIILSIFFIGLIFKTDITIIANSIIKLLITIVYTSILMYTTSIKNINYGLNKLCSPLKIIKVNPNQMSFILTFSIKFIEVVMEQVDILLKTFKYRGLDFKGSIIDRINNLKIFTSTLFYLLLKKVNYISIMFEIRNCNLDKFINSYKIKITFLDTIFILIHISVILIIKGVIK